MLEIFRKPETATHINPRFRAYGKARIDIAQRAVTRDDWDRLWKKTTNPFPFSWGESWKQCIEYKVADFPAEVGFFIDILGFPVNAFDPDYAMFTSPNGDFYFSVVPALKDEAVTPPEAIRLQFMVEHISDTVLELERRGVKFDQLPARVAENSSLLIGSFHSPHGIGIDLWGFDPQLILPETDQLKALMGKEQARSEDQPKNINGEEQLSDKDQLLFVPADQSPAASSRQVGSHGDKNDPQEVEYVPDEEL